MHQNGIDHAKCPLNKHYNFHEGHYFKLRNVNWDTTNESTNNAANNSTAEQNNVEKFSHINGWGADLDHKNRPAYPMERTPPRLEGVHWDTPAQQAENVQILCSNERPGTTPVFGSTLPPAGISGMMREAASKYSENDLRHWGILLLADRVNMVEGVVADLSRGHIPNLYAETGMKSDFQFNRVGAIKKTAIAASVVGVGIYTVIRKKKIV